MHRHTAVQPSQTVFVVVSSSDQNRATTLSLPLSTKESQFPMQSLGLKTISDLNSASGGGRRCILPGPSRMDCKNITRRTLKIVACLSSDKNGVGVEKQISTSRTHTYALLKQQMEVAVKSEDYKEAARIRDSLRLFEEEEPVLRLLRSLKEAVADERFEDAAKIRDELKLVAPHALLKCSSDATTLGIRVQVRSVYIEDRSQPSKGQYFFAYRIRITNNSERPVQLLRRHWMVTDANGRSENIWGIGVIGQQPVILPQTGFEYSSACPLSTPNGKMEGDFEMKHTDKVGTSTFNVEIAPFSLSVVGDDSEVI